MSFLRIPFLLLLGSCTTKVPEGTATDRPQRPIDDADADTDGGDSDGLIADADADAGSDGDTGEDSGEPSDDVDAPYALRVTPAAVTFGAVSVGEMVRKSVDIKNVGTESVHINGLGVSDRTVFDFLTDFGDYVTLLPGMEGTVHVDFTPAEDRTYSAEITLVTEEVLVESADIPLQGRGESGPCEICTPIIDVHPGELTLDAVLTCEASDSVTVTNEGDRPLRITGVDIINGWPSCGNFNRSFGGPVTLAPYESTSIIVTYRATSECADLVSLSADDNTMHIISNDPADPDYTVGLTGYATCLFGK